MTMFMPDWSDDVFGEMALDDGRCFASHTSTAPESTPAFVTLTFPHPCTPRRLAVFAHEKKAAGTVTVPFDQERQLVAPFSGGKVKVVELDGLGLGVLNYLKMGLQHLSEPFTSQVVLCYTRPM